MPTQIPPPLFGPNGFTSPVESALLAGALADINTAFGNQLNTGLTTPQGQLASTLSAIVADKDGQFAAIANGVDPAFATGRMQDAIGRIYFLTRIQAAATVLEVLCTGAIGTVIPAGSTVVDAAGNIYASNLDATIPSYGFVYTDFSCTVPGPVPVPAATGISIYTSVFGWDSATVAGGFLGNNVESRAAFEQRRAASVAINGAGFLPTILSNVLAVPNVLSAYVTENNGATELDFGSGSNTVGVAPNSLFVSVIGGDPQAIGNAIWLRKPPGCNTSGNTRNSLGDVHVTVLDPGYNQPQPQYQITFVRAGTSPTAFAVTLKNSQSIPGNATQLIQGAIQAAFVGADCTFIGHIDNGQVNVASGAQLTVTSVLTGVLTVGQLVFGQGIADGTAITALLSGNGGVGTYTVSIPQFVTSQNMATGPVNPFQVPTRASIGGTIYAGSFYATVAALGPWVQLISIGVASAQNATCAFQGSIAAAGSTGSVLTSTGMTGGTKTLGPGQFLYGAGVPSGTLITSQLTSAETGGTLGGLGTYQLNQMLPQTPATGTMSMYTLGPTNNYVTININAMPTLAAADVNVLLV